MSIMHVRTRSRVLCLFVVLCCLSGCATSAGTTAPGKALPPSGATATASPATPPCATTPTGTASSRIVDKQVIGTPPGGPMGALSKFIPPLGLSEEDVFAHTTPYFTTWSPDGKHLATLVEVIVPSQIISYPYIIDTTTHVVKQVLLPSPEQLATPTGMEWSRERSLAWANNDTLLIFGASPTELGGPGGSFPTTSYSYDLSSGTLTPLPGVTSAVQGVVRCNTLFYLQLSAMTAINQCDNFNNQIIYWYKGSARLHRYNLLTQTEIGVPVTLGDTSSCPFFNDGEVDAMGWDVTANGQRIVYQHTTVVAFQQLGVKTTSKFFAADADGGNPIPILTAAPSDANAYLRISPDDLLVALVAQPVGQLVLPTVYTGRITGVGTTASYAPAAGGLPAWTADSQGFAASQAGGEMPGTNLDIEQYTVGVPNATSTVGTAHHPASLP
jgi:hypothetical protein